MGNRIRAYLVTYIFLMKKCRMALFVSYSRKQPCHQILYLNWSLQSYKRIFFTQLKFPLKQFLKLFKKIELQILRMIKCVFYREAIQEDEKGSLQASVEDIISKAKKRKLLEKIKNVRLGMVSSIKGILPWLPSTSICFSCFIVLFSDEAFVSYH